MEGKKKILQLDKMQAAAEEVGGLVQTESLLIIGSKSKINRSRTRHLFFINSP